MDIKMDMIPYLSALLTVLLLFYVAPKIISLIVRREFTLLGLIKGEDHYLSTSKFQILVWTVVAIASWVGLFVIKLWFVPFATDPGFTAFVDIPPNIMWLMGLSGGVFVAAKAIATVRKGKPPKKPPTPVHSIMDLIADNEGNLDLGKFQMVVWTLVAAGAYLLLVFGTTIPDALEALRDVLAGPQTPLLEGASEAMKEAAEKAAEAKDMLLGLSLPDITAGMLILMGASQGTYLGMKLSSPIKPVVSSISPNSGPATQDTEVIITGMNFSSASMVKIGDRPLHDVEFLAIGRLKAKVPSGGTAGTYDVIVTNPNGQTGKLERGFIVV